MQSGERIGERRLGSRRRRKRKARDIAREDVFG
jgi:hypothetical protein